MFQEDSDKEETCTTFGDKCTTETKVFKIVGGTYSNEFCKFTKDKVTEESWNNKVSWVTGRWKNT